MRQEQRHKNFKSVYLLHFNFSNLKIPFKIQSKVENPKGEVVGEAFVPTHVVGCSLSSDFDQSLLQRSKEKTQHIKQNDVKKYKDLKSKFTAESAYACVCVGDVLKCLF